MSAEFPSPDLAKASRWPAPVITTQSSPGDLFTSMPSSWA